MSTRIDVLAKSVALQRTREQVMRAAVDVGREVAGSDAAFAAVPEPPGGFRIALSSGIRDERFHDVVVRHARGLGGQVLSECRALHVPDYVHAPGITHDYMAAVASERLRSIACVPIAGPDGTEALLYAAVHGPGVLGDRAIEQLERVARYAEVGLCEVAGRERELELERMRERERLATRLHDSVAQMLFSIGVTARASHRAQDAAALAAAMREVEQTAAAARRELRATLQRLDSCPRGMALDARLEGELRLVERTTHCTVRVVRSGTPQALAEPVEQLLFDAALEGVRNAVKHAAARLVLVYLRYEPRRVALAVQTEVAAGARQAPLRAAGTGAGVALLRERAARLRGAFELTTDGKGLKLLRLELPVAATGRGEGPCAR